MIGVPRGSPAERRASMDLHLEVVDAIEILPT
jgi:hypothetical protein